MDPSVARQTILGSHRDPMRFERIAVLPGKLPELFRRFYRAVANATTSKGTDRKGRPVDSNVTHVLLLRESTDQLGNFHRNALDHEFLCRRAIGIESNAPRYGATWALFDPRHLGSAVWVSYGGVTLVAQLDESREQWLLELRFRNAEQMNDGGANYPQALDAVLSVAQADRLGGIRLPDRLQPNLEPICRKHFGTSIQIIHP